LVLRGETDMKAYMSIIVGQEIDGKNLVIKVEKVSCKKEVIDQLLTAGRNNWVERHKVPEGEVPMYFSRNAQEILVEDVEHNQQT
jgi:hypothetical protein